MVRYIEAFMAGEGPATDKPVLQKVILAVRILTRLIPAAFEHEQASHRLIHMLVPPLQESNNVNPNFWAVPWDSRFPS